MPKPEKVQAVQELRARLQRARGVILADFRGLSVPELESLREELRKNGVELRVVKNTLFGLAAQEEGLRGLEPFLLGPTAVAFAYDDPTVPARTVMEFIRQHRKLEVKGGFVEGRVVDAAGVRALAELPSRAELLARVVGGVQAPLGGLVRLLTGLQRNLLYALDQIRQRRESQA
ncbi:MAG: 50S ribosomal protein L10 [Armatimonadota bacterium]|nr:50S ribosomal protein L10 [Armatimonadota bacterium]MDR7439312.1 50S ribosomal protein L10 [Armatimonadota bacterium]MDR7562002.1 50S ribosomal protein L10 [Armatimonadota bacterium]MDR7567024.1 50S ribosomal protein L10 [Armatimonadota bacterium]MDR7602760.1 50S ribosomal protein L10 [Armatimonadota bacterium]